MLTCPLVDDENVVENVRLLRKAARLARVPFGGRYEEVRAFESGRIVRVHVCSG
jgi:hypothetical protein